MVIDFVTMAFRKRIHYLLSCVPLLVMLGALMLPGCTMQRRKTDAELGLSPFQAMGRHVFDAHCARCHEPYSRWGLHGPSLEHLYKKKYMPSGMPANDIRITDVIIHGKAKMPAFGGEIDETQLNALLAYLKTL